MAILLLCLKVFFVRILDVSLGTLRTIVTVKGKILIAAMIGFVEVLVWFLVVREALNTDINSIWVAISYAGGFATGTLIGGYLSSTFISGNLSVQIITTANETSIHKLRQEGYGVSVIPVDGHDDTIDKKMLFIEINNKSLQHLQKVVKKEDPSAFIVVNETKYVQNGFIK